jgi:hypothetical protein
VAQEEARQARRERAALRALQDAQRQAGLAARTCQQCGKGFSDRQADARYCSKTCQAEHNWKAQAAAVVAAREARPFRPCSECGTDISQRHTLATRCEECQETYRKGRPRKRLVGERNCSLCGTSIRGRAKHAVLCAPCETPPRWCIGCGQVDLRGTHHLRCGPCKDEYRAAKRENDREANSQYMREWQKANPLKVQFWARRREAREKGREFAITLEALEAIWPPDNRCPVCGVTFTREHADAAAGSIDRIRNDQGYVLRNVHVVCVGCNGRKGGTTLQELLDGAAGPDWKAWARARLERPEEAA